MVECTHRDTLKVANEGGHAPDLMVECTPAPERVLPDFGGHAPDLMVECTQGFQHTPRVRGGHAPDLPIERAALSAQKIKDTRRRYATARRPFFSSRCGRFY